jgi:hypothetical protein
MARNKPDAVGPEKKPPVTRGFRAGDRTRTGDPHLGKAIWSINPCSMTNRVLTLLQVRHVFLCHMLDRSLSSFVLLTGAELERELGIPEV